MSILRKISNLFVIGLIFFALLLKGGFASKPSKADFIYKKAKSNYKIANYKKSMELYKKSRKEYLREKEKQKASLCRKEIFKIKMILNEYPLSKKEALKKLDAFCVGFSREEKEKLMENLKKDCLVFDGKPRYFWGFIDNIFFRNVDLVKRLPKLVAKKRLFAKFYGDIIFRSIDNCYKLKPWNYYIFPQEYIGKMEVNIPRKELPKKGVYRLWVPGPIQTDSQRNIKVISITPKEYLMSPLQVNRDIGALYFEIPLKDLKKDLNVSILFSFVRYEQYFNVDPDKVGEYDKKSVLYKNYTKSGQNIIVNEEIKKKALEIVGDEKNPYLQAKKINYYIIKNCKYSYMPHLYLYQTNQPESIFVLKNMYGDCGSQAMFFSALCRSIGIPARATGGYLLTPGRPSGHFWGEFYIPNYGWIPIDTTITESVLYSDLLSKSQKKKVINYYFGHLDNRRMVIQKDCDIPVYPKQAEKPAFGPTIQVPRAQCDSMENSPDELAIKYFKYYFETSY